MTAELGLLLGTLTLSPAEVVLSLAVCILAATYAYRAAVRFRSLTGVTPWRWPPGLWAVVFFLSWIVGLLLFLLARRTTRLPAAPLPGPATGLVEPAAAAPQPAETHVPAHEHLPYAGWYHDPGGRHELRYWDGKGWTDYVSDQGVRTEDPG